jgi:hypothetical protein
MHNHADFLRLVLAEFPELRGTIDDCDGLPYLEMGAFALFTQKAKKSERWDTYERAANIVTKLLADADKDLRNVLYVAYLEHLDFEGPRGLTAWRLLPNNVQRAWHEIIEYNEQLLGRPMVRTKPKVTK